MNKLTLLNNRYRIIKELGSGGFGETFLSEDTQMPSERRCVVKQLKPVTANPQIFQLINERFAREAAILEALGEGNRQIPRLYAYFEEQSQFYLVQEWIEGETLTNRVENQGKMSESSVREILISLLPVLEFVHSQRIVHRDIKPDNIMLRKSDGIPILIDFGAVKETMGTVMNSSGNGTSSIVIGTPGFMPSEQAAGRPVYSSDLYSLGLTAIYLLTEKWPQELAINHDTGEVIWRQYAPRISPSLATVLDKAIMSHSRDRFHSAGEMLSAIATPVSNAPTLAALSLAENPTVAISPRGSNSQTPLVNSRDSSKPILISSAITGGLIGASILIGFAIHKSTPPSSEPTTVEAPTTSPSTAALPPPSETLTVTENPNLNASTHQPPFDSRGIQNQTDEYSWLSVRRVTDADLVGKTAFQLDIMRNGIFARHGRRFNNQALQSYFNSQPWYIPIYDPDIFPNNLLSNLEQENVQYILDFQNRNGLR
ncbi:protein kinase domain-containing protein [Laspinema olomoucense]|uniref:non-specific serine/threonine protein kinase n=1 Tax=Laspinema olomoucense D3b TaxID=2953688 RepID=A0ABT2NH59_9CYAN|nr:YARHG domain-containing protein [Laspinema sp. D3b]MCT7981224.1 YARHG domain-containing protein [Laspinema sp. D3b]